LSLGGGGYSETTNEFYEEFYEDGVLFVAAAGNGGNSNYLYPASYKSLMSVAANDANENKASFSQYNDQVEISAAGVGVLSTLPNNSYDAWSGTSMATPHVAGVAGLLWLHFPECKNYQIREAMLRTAKDINSDSKPGCDNEFGHGMVQAKDAYLLLESGFCDNDSGYVAPVGGCEQLTCSDNSDCDDGDECTIDACSSSQCTHTPDCDACGATVCDDGDPCTLDTCDYTDGCSHDFSCALCGEAGAAETVVKVTTDTYYSETSWKVEGGDGSTVISKDSYPSKDSFEDNYCLDEGVYTFTIYDTWGDGICCSWGEGSYEVLVKGESVASGGEFTDEESTSFEVTVDTTSAPVTAPTTPAPMAPPTTGPPTSCSSPSEVLVEVTSDNWPGDISWYLKNVATDEELLSGGEYTEGNTLYSSSIDLCDGTYEFRIDDSWGDGLCCSYGEGSYSVKVDSSVVASGAEYASFESTVFTIPTGSPPSAPTPTTPVAPPTPYPTGKAPTPWPTGHAPTPWPTHTPPTPHPTGALPM